MCSLSALGSVVFEQWSGYVCPGRTSGIYLFDFPEWLQSGLNSAVDMCALSALGSVVYIFA